MPCFLAPALAYESSAQRMSCVGCAANSTHKRPLRGHCAPVLGGFPANRAAPAACVLGDLHSKGGPLTISGKRTAFFAGYERTRLEVKPQSQHHGAFRSAPARKEHSQDTGSALAAEHNLGENHEKRRKDGEAEVFSRRGEILADECERCLAAAVRDGDDDDAREHDADDGLADDEARREERAAAAARALSLLAAARAGVS